MKISRSSKTRRPVNAEAEVDVAPEATDLLFEAEDVADLVADVTEQDVEVEATDDSVTFTVGGEDVYTVEPEEEIETLESSAVVRGRKVTASTRRTRRPVKASTRTNKGNTRRYVSHPNR